MNNDTLSNVVYETEKLEALSQSACGKIREYFLTLHFSGKRLEHREQEKLQKFLHNGKGVLHYSVDVPPLGINEPPRISFSVMPKSMDTLSGSGTFGGPFQPKLSEEGNRFKKDLSELLSFEELYSIAILGIQRKVQFYTDMLLDVVASGSVGRRVAFPTTVGDSIEIDLNHVQSVLKDLQTKTVSNIHTSLQF